ncbi:MAG: hypothetical protein MJZ26_04195 [Fibrobacter sp.]|nr:hypothetical protein [Fibrobacter sp.]
MKASSFITGLALGAAAAVAVVKKFNLVKSGESSATDASESPALKDAENAVETLRSSVDILRKELNTRIESEQTYAAECEDLKDQVAKKDVEIRNLQNICDKQAGLTKKLEVELDDVKEK